MFRCQRLKQARAERARRKIDRAERHALDLATARFWRAYDQCKPSAEKRLACAAFHFGQHDSTSVLMLANKVERLAELEKRDFWQRSLNQLTDAGVSALLRTITEEPKCE